MSDVNQNQPTQPTGPLLMPKQKWYRHKGVYTIIILAVIAGVAIWVYTVLNQPLDSGQSVIKRQQNNTLPNQQQAPTALDQTSTTTDTTEINLDTSKWEIYNNLKYNYQVKIPYELGDGSQYGRDFYCDTSAETLTIYDQQKKPLFKINGSNFITLSDSPLTQKIFTTFKLIDPMVQTDKSTWLKFTDSKLGISLSYPKSYNPASGIDQGRGYIVIESPLTPIVSSAECTTGEVSDAIYIDQATSSAFSYFLSEEPFVFSEYYFSSEKFNNSFNHYIGKVLVDGHMGFQFIHSEMNSIKYTVIQIDKDNYLMVSQDLFNWNQWVEDKPGFNVKTEPYDGIVDSIKFNAGIN